VHTYTITTTRETYDVEAVDRHHARDIAERRGGTIVRIERVRDESCTY
jgi:hypothetical protein